MHRMPSRRVVESALSAGRVGAAAFAGDLIG